METRLDLAQSLGKAILAAVQARPTEAQTQLLLAMIGQEMDLVLLAATEGGARLRLPGGQVLEAEGELPYPPGTRLSAQVLEPAGQGGAPRLRLLEARPPAPPPILAPLTQGEAGPLLARLQAPEPPPALQVLVKILEALRPPPADPPVQDSRAGRLDPGPQAQDRPAPLPHELIESVRDLFPGKPSTLPELVHALRTWIREQPRGTPPAGQDPAPRPADGPPPGTEPQAPAQYPRGLPAGESRPTRPWFLPPGPPAPGASAPEPPMLPEALPAPRVPRGSAPPGSGGLPEGDPNPPASGSPSPRAKVLPEGDEAVLLWTRLEASLLRNQAPPEAKDALKALLRQILQGPDPTPRRAVPQGPSQPSPGRKPAAMPAPPEPGRHPATSLLTREGPPRPGTSAELPGQGPSAERPESWAAWLEEGVRILGNPAASPREAPFHLAQAREGTGFFELPLPWGEGPPLQLWVESEGGRGGDPGPGERSTLLLGLHFSALGEVRVGLLRQGGPLVVRIWAEDPGPLEALEVSLKEELEGLGSAVDLKILPLGPEGGHPPSLSALASGSSFQALG
ncbi:MAG: hypothetical protein HY823_00995 [Acidobacteria bacterium]|nr:hypothetical protein [Acidobacteriota bacterium]